MCPMCQLCMSPALPKLTHAAQQHMLLLSSHRSVAWRLLGCVISSWHSSSIVRLSFLLVSSWLRLLKIEDLCTHLCGLLSLYAVGYCILVPNAKAGHFLNYVFWCTCLSGCLPACLPQERHLLAFVIMTLHSSLHQASTRVLVPFHPFLGCAVTHWRIHGRRQGRTCTHAQSAQSRRPTRQPT